jgi:hypothetical protein
MSLATIRLLQQHSFSIFPCVLSCRQTTDTTVNELLLGLAFSTLVPTGMGVPESSGRKRRPKHGQATKQTKRVYIENPAAPHTSISFSLHSKRECDKNVLQ